MCKVKYNKQKLNKNYNKNRHISLDSDVIEGNHSKNNSTDPITITDEILKNSHLSLPRIKNY